MTNISASDVSAAEVLDILQNEWFIPHRRTVMEDATTLSKSFCSTVHSNGRSETNDEEEDHPKRRNPMGADANEGFVMKLLMFCFLVFRPISLHPVSTTTFGPLAG